MSKYKHSKPDDGAGNSATSSSPGATGSKPDSVDDSKRSSDRRRFLVGATATVGVVGAAAASWSLLSSLRPSAAARISGGPVRVDVDAIRPGNQVTLSWRGKPVWVLHRTPEILERLAHPHLSERLRDPDSEVVTQQPGYAQNTWRSIRPEYLVVIALCTHLGCIPTFRPRVSPEDLGSEWMGGYFCPCHKSKFDLAGRAYKAVPAPTNLVVPPYHYPEPGIVEIGVDPEK